MNPICSKRRITSLHCPPHIIYKLHICTFVWSSGTLTQSRIQLHAYRNKLPNSHTTYTRQQNSTISDHLPKQSARSDQRPARTCTRIFRKNLFHAHTPECQHAWLRAFRRPTRLDRHTACVWCEHIQIGPGARARRDDLLILYTINDACCWKQSGTNRPRLCSGGVEGTRGQTRKQCSLAGAVLRRVARENLPVQFCNAARVPGRGDRRRLADTADRRYRAYLCAKVAVMEVVEVEQPIVAHHHHGAVECRRAVCPPRTAPNSTARKAIKPISRIFPFRPHSSVQKQWTLRSISAIKQQIQPDMWRRSHTGRRSADRVIRNTTKP